MLRRLRFAFRRSEKTFLAILLILAALIAFLIPSVRFFRTLTGTMAVSDASDLITKTVSDIVEKAMRELPEEERSFVSFAYGENGGVVAALTDTARVNILSSELLNAVVEASDRGDLNLEIPLGNLLGMNLLLGRGPHIPVRVTMLTSSRVDLKNVLSDAGINQTRHQLMLEIHVDVDVLLPWEIRSAQVVTEVLLAETVLIGQTPETYVKVGE